MSEHEVIERLASSMLQPGQHIVTVEESPDHPEYLRVRLGLGETLFPRDQCVALGLVPAGWFR